MISGADYRVAVVVAVVVAPPPEAAEATVAPNSLSLEARAALQKEQMLNLNEYIYDLNTRKQLARPKRTVNTYAPKQKEFMVRSQRITVDT